MQKSSRKLNLFRETLIRLDPSTTAKIAAGVTTEPGFIARKPTLIEITGTTCETIPVVTTFC